MRDRLPSPARIEQEMNQLISLCDRTKRLATGVKGALEEVHEQAYWGASGNGSITPGRSSVKDSNPTPNAALSAPLMALRSRVFEALKELQAVPSIFRKAVPHLDKAEGILKTGAIKALDPEMKQKLDGAAVYEREYAARRGHRKA